MAITFNALQDPWGLREAGGTLGQALMERGREERKDQSQREREQRALEQQKNASSALGGVLSKFQPKEEGQTWDQNRIGDFMVEALQQGASFNDVLNAAKIMQAPQLKTRAAPPSILEKEQEKGVAKYILDARQKASSANELLAQYPDLMAAINSPELAQQNFLQRAFTSAASKLPFGQGVTMNPQEQVIASLSKQMVTELTNLKGLRLTDPKLKWLENAVVQVGKTPEANRKAAQITFDLMQIAAQKPAIIDSIIAENNGVPPLDIQTQVDKRIGSTLNEYVNQHMEPLSTSEIGTHFDKMPDANKFSGKKIRDEKGNIFQSDGKKWKKVG